MDLSIIIPAYNEMNNIEETIWSLCTVLDEAKNLKSEIIVVDDASYDLTPLLIKSISRVNVITNKTNKGKGYSVKRGITASKGTYIAVFDADMPYMPSCILKSYSLTDKYDIIYGKRYAQGNYPPLRYVASKAFHLITKYYLGLGDADTQCGFKMFKKCLIENPESIITLNRFSYDIQLAHHFKKCGANWFNMDVVVKKHSYSSVNIIKDGARLMYDIWRIKNGLC